MSDDLAFLERLETPELRDRAVSLARRRWDVRFFWRLLELLPAAEAAAGNLEASEAGVSRASGLFYDALGAEDDPRVQEALRPVYIDYLSKHGASGEEAAGPADGTDRSTAETPNGSAEDAADSGQDPNGRT
ncbi:hypothetical protein GCM10027570_23210 [Streptomonospora sediminis]